LRRRYVTDGGDTISEAANSGTDIVQSSISHALGANIENLALTGTAAINGNGNALDNLLRGNAAANVLNGGGGSDTVTEAAGGGTDTVQSSIRYSLGAYVENLTLTGRGIAFGI
jgi:Ca2+-binding RTX toxin-like protein